jgi:hypothetical protein
MLDVDEAQCLFFSLARAYSEGYMHNVTLVWHLYRDGTL